MFSTYSSLHSLNSGMSNFSHHFGGKFFAKLRNSLCFSAVFNALSSPLRPFLVELYRTVLKSSAASLAYLYFSEADFLGVSGNVSSVKRPVSSALIESLLSVGLLSATSCLSSFGYSTFVLFSFLTSSFTVETSRFSFFSASCYIYFVGDVAFF